MNVARFLDAKLSSPLRQYLIGASVNLVYILILLFNNESYMNLQLPEGAYQTNLWKGSDVLTYVRPARNFVEFHVFGQANVPDYHRTIGYPLFLSLLMVSFGDMWLIGTFIVQALIFACIYPALNKTCKLLMDNSPRVAVLSFSFLILSGTFIALVPAIQTDLLFAVIVTIGIYFGLESVVRKSWFFLALHIAFIGYAAQVRPLLGLYPIVDAFVLIYVAFKRNNLFDASLRKLLAASSVCLFIICNLPSLRNYINYGFLMPTNVLSTNMYDYLAHRVLTRNGRLDEYQSTLGNNVDVREAIKTKERAALQIYKEYPITTLFQLGRNAIGILVRSHWTWATQFWGYSFQDNFEKGLMPKKKSSVLFYIEVFFNVVYATIYLCLFTYMVWLYRTRQFGLLLTVMVFLSYFLVPTFMVDGAGSRFRLPVEGMIVYLSFHGLECVLQNYHLLTAARDRDGSQG
jgi:hypothetical protein